MYDGFFLVTTPLSIAQAFLDAELVGNNLRYEKYSTSIAKGCQIHAIVKGILKCTQADRQTSGSVLY